MFKGFDRVANLKEIIDNKLMEEVLIKERINLYLDKERITEEQAQMLAEKLQAKYHPVTPSDE